MTLKVGSTVIKHVADYLRFQLHRAAEARFKMEPWPHKLNELLAQCVA